MTNRVAISSGDFNGIGPEIILKTLQDHTLKGVTPIVLSTSSVINYYSELLPFKLEYHHAFSSDEIKDGVVNLLESYDQRVVSVQPGSFTEESGKCAMLAVEKGVELCKKGKTDALVTAPISKEAVNLAGYHIPGHTEFLAEHTGAKNFMMMLVHRNLRVALTTIHIPIVKVADQISEAVVRRCMRILHKSLQQDFNIATPKIAVLGLNPHAGDGGVIGTEEKEVISPALERARSEGFSVTGPHPADGFFGSRKYENYDAVLAMYHDQGLVPFKTISFGAGVNFTAGLPIIRTSPDHGTAFDIAGQNKADPSSFKEAFSLALELVSNRKKKLAD